LKGTKYIAVQGLEMRREKLLWRLAIISVEVALSDIKVSVL